MASRRERRSFLFFFAVFVLGFDAQAYRTVRAYAHHRNDAFIQKPSQVYFRASDARPGSLLQNPVETSARKSWFQRMGEAFGSMFFGLFFVIPFSVAFLWINERRNAQLQSVLSHGESEVRTVEAKADILEDSDGTLVHLNSEKATGMDPLTDARFPSVQKQSGCLRLRSRVEVFQWKEEENTGTKKDSVGGGETTTKTYSYKKEWCESEIDSSGFHQGEHQNSCFVKGLEIGTQEVINATVKYGEPFWLPREMVEQLDNFESASEMVGESLACSNTPFKLNADGWYYCPESVGAPSVGDCRAKIEYVLDGPVSILALQMKDDAYADRRTFGPYRSVSRGFCCFGVDESELQRRRVEAARKSPDELYEEQKCLDFGPFACLCCCCNLVTRIFSAVGVPQIYSAYTGSLDAKKCFEAEKLKATMAKWALRLLGWLLMWAGLNMVFAPLHTFVDIIPFLGPYIGTGLGWVLSLITFLVTLSVATLIISVAYLLYNPLIGALYMLVAGGIFVGMTFAANALKQKGA